MAFGAGGQGGESGWEVRERGGAVRCGFGELCGRQNLGTYLR